MEHTYWRRQKLDSPLFDDILWSKPENKAQAGRLLIIGGNLHAFAAVAQSYQTALTAGIGAVKIVIPDALQKTVGHILTDVDYAPSTPSGSFAKLSLDTWIGNALTTDGVLLPGDLGRNSETAITLETFLKKYTGKVVITRDAEDYFRDSPLTLLDRGETLLVVSFADLQKLAATAQFKKAFTFDMDFMRLVDTLHEFSSEHQAIIAVMHHSQLLNAPKGKVITTDVGREPSSWRTQFAARASVFWIQHPHKPLEAIASSIIPE